MEQYQQRAIKDENELREKLFVLEHFISSDPFDEVSDEEASCLIGQFNAMKEYHHHLKRRIKLWQK